MARITFPIQKASVSQKKRTALIGQGQRMSNWFYNVAQLDDVPEWIRRDAKELVDAWDKIKLVED